MYFDRQKPFGRIWIAWSKLLPRPPIDNGKASPVRSFHLDVLLFAGRIKIVAVGVGAAYRQD